MTRTSSRRTDNFRLSRDQWGRLILTDAEGRQHANVRVRRMFPITDPDYWITLRDGQGRELIVIEDPALLPEDQRQFLAEELARHGFLPRIHAILSITRVGDALHWRAETDRGVTQFKLENSEAIRSLGNQEMLLVDEHGLRYLVPDITELDPTSRRNLEKCLY